MTKGPAVISCPFCLETDMVERIGSIYFCAVCSKSFSVTREVTVQKSTGAINSD